MVLRPRGAVVEVRDDGPRSAAVEGSGGSRRAGDRRLLVVVAHPDDESFGCGSLIAHAVRGGASVTVCCATRGEAGDVGEGCDVGGDDLPTVRQRELEQAAVVLGADRVVLLDHVDSGMSGTAGPATLAGAPFEDVVEAVARVVADVDPHVVVTMDETGGDGHRDHVRIAAATTEAVRRHPGPHLYQWCLSRRLLHRWVDALRSSLPESEHLDLDVTVMGRPDDEITTLLDVADLEALRWEAIRTHASQRSPYEVMPADLREAFLRTDLLVRILPPWTGGPVEHELCWPAPPATAPS